MDRLRFAIVGVGNRGKSLIRAARATGQVEFVAFADPHEPSRAVAHDLLPEAHAYARWEDLLGDLTLDAVVVATPNHRHTDVVLAALHAGAHVLCEKPLALTTDECDLMIEHAGKTGKVLQVGMELRFAPMVQDVKAMIEHGVIGDVKMAWCHEFRPPFRSGVDGWRLSQRTSGGSLLEKNCHHFDLFNWISGSKPLRVRAVGSNDTIYRQRDILDRAWVTVEYLNGMHGNLGLCLFYPKERLEIGFLGTDGSIECFAAEGKTVVATRNEETIRRYPAAGRDRERSGYEHPGEVEQQLAFIRSIRNDELPLVDGEAAKWSQVVSLAAEQAVRSGSIVSIGPEGGLTLR
jgi:predicted dehydrogenase